MNKLPPDFQQLDLSAALIVKENLKIEKQLNKHFNLFGEEVYMIGFGEGVKSPENLKGMYVYWVWYKDTPYAGMMNCKLSNKFDSIDYYEITKQNAEDSIKAVLEEKNDKE